MLAKQKLSRKRVW